MCYNVKYLTMLQRFVMMPELLVGTLALRRLDKNDERPFSDASDEMFLVFILTTYCIQIVEWKFLDH